MNRVIKALIITASALFEVSAYSQQLTIMQLKDALKHQYTPQAVQATGYVLGAYDAMTGIVHCPTGMTPTRDTLIKWTQEGLERYHGPNRGADHLLAAVFAQRAPCAKKGVDMRDTDVQREINRMSRKYDDDDIQEYARPWRGLTDEELLQAYGWVGAPMPKFIVEQAKQELLGALRKVEAKLKEKNSG